MTYDLRRLRLHGIIERIAHSHRYQLTPEGLRIALFFSRAYAPAASPQTRRDHAALAAQRIRVARRIRPPRLRNRRLLSTGATVCINPTHLNYIS